MRMKKHLIESRRNRKDSIEDVAITVNSEGLGYAIQSYLDWKNIEDKKLSRLWKIAGDAMDDIESILGPYLD